MTENITEQDITWAIAQGACSDAIHWLREQPRTIAETIERHGAWLLEHVFARLTAEQFATAVAAAPESALQYKHACDRLSAAQFNCAVATCPYSALEYEHACCRLTDAQFATAIAVAPSATDFDHVCLRQRTAPA